MPLSQYHIKKERNSKKVIWCDSIISFDSYQVSDGHADWLKERHKIIWSPATNSFDVSKEMM